MPPEQQQQQDGAKAALCRWQKLPEGEGLELVHQHSVTHVAWHARGDYFASVAPTGNTQVSRGLTGCGLLCHHFLWETCALPALF